MEALLIAAALTCADGAWILEGIRSSKVDSTSRTELRLEIIQIMPDTCTPEQYNPAGRK
jgi:hypothetical protein